MRTSFWVPEKRADTLVEFRRDDVLESARLHVRFGIFNRERVSEKTFSETVTAHDIARAA